MHRITKAHLDSFVASYGLEQHGEDVQFEMFVNKSVLASKIGGSFELEEVTTGPSEDGSDGVAVILDEDLVVSKEDAESVFSSCLLYTSPSPRDRQKSRMPSSA